MVDEPSGPNEEELQQALDRAADDGWPSRIARSRARRIARRRHAARSHFSAPGTMPNLPEQPGTR